LAHVGIVRRPRLLTLLARWQGVAARIKAGRHVLKPPLTPRTLVHALVHNPPRRDVKVTVPEGSNVWQTAGILAAAGICERDAFLAAVKGLEGRLFPDTYFFHPGAKPAQVARAMRARFDTVWAGLRREHPGPIPQGLSDEQALIMASLVEEEAQLAKERPVIARVFYNRLLRKMRLETDPTCVYGPDTYEEVPSPRRCKDPDNRWSTYVIHGLPPGPISSPGRASLEAAIAPSTREGDDRLLFFVARRDGRGGHHFSRTYDEHSRAVRQYLKGR